MKKSACAGSIICISLILLSCISVSGKKGFNDPVLEKNICTKLGVEPSQLDAEKLKTLKELDAADSGITSLSGIELCENLEKIHLPGNRIADISPLKALRKNLRELDLSGNRIKNIEPLSGCTALVRLDLGYNRIEKIDALADLKSLEYLRLAGNPVRSFDILSRLTALKELLDISNTGFYGTIVLEKLVKLEKLNLAFTRVEDITPLKNLSGLKYLNLGVTLFLDDISPLLLVQLAGGLKKGSVVDLSYARSEIILESKNIDTIKSLTYKGVKFITKTVREHRNSDFGKDIFPWVRILQMGDMISEDERSLLLEKSLNVSGRYFLVAQAEGDNRDAVEMWISKFSSSKAMLDLVRKTVNRVYESEKANLKKTDPKKLVEKVSSIIFSGLKTQESFWINYDYIDTTDFRVKNRYECFMLFTVLRENVLNSLKSYAEKIK